jgi:hypothetical protein
MAKHRSKPDPPPPGLAQGKPRREPRGNPEITPDPGGEV